jgi:hypothetical protein
MARRPDEADTIRDDDGNDDHMTLVADCLGLGRGLQLVTEPTHEALGNERRDNHHCRIPTPEKNYREYSEMCRLDFSKPPDSVTCVGV